MLDVAEPGAPGPDAATGEEQPDAATYGVALLSRFPVSAWQIVRLPVLRTAVPIRFRGQPLPSWVRDEPRVAVAATVDGPAGSMTVACPDLSFVSWWNGRRLRALAWPGGRLPARAAEVSKRRSRVRSGCRAASASERRRDTPTRLARPAT